MRKHNKAKLIYLALGGGHCEEMVFKLRAEGEQDSPGWECRQQSLWQEECMEALRGAEKGATLEE